MEGETYPDGEAARRDGNGPCVIYTSYIQTLSGVLQIAEMVLGLITWSCVASVYVYGIFGFTMFVFVSAWITTVISFIFNLFGFPGARWNINYWNIQTFFVTVIVAVLYFVAFIITAVRTYNNSTLQAAAAFAFFTACAYIAHSFVAFEKWKGSYPWVFFRTQGNVVTA